MDGRGQQGRFALLLGLGLLSALVWRIELEVRWGWAGIDWAFGRHGAPWFGGLLFLAWVAWMSYGHARQLRLLLLTGAAGVVLLLATEQIARIFWGGEIGLLIPPVTTMTGVVFVIAVAAAAWVACLAPVYLVFFLHYHLRALDVVVGASLWLGSWFLGRWILAVIPERGPADLIHALKTGWMIPYLVVAAGLPLLRAQVRLRD